MRPRQSSCVTIALSALSVLLPSCGGGNSDATGYGPTSPKTPGLILFSSDFESSDLAGWNQESAALPYAAQIVDSPVRSGSKSIRFELHQTDPDVSGSRRSELALTSCQQNGEFWYAFSIYLPPDYATDVSPEILAQWHNVPDTDLGETWTSPPLALQTRNGGWLIQRLWDDATISSNESMFAKGDTSNHDLGAYDTDKGRWTDWVFHIKWGWLVAQGPKLEVFKNGTLVLDQNGLPNTMNDHAGPYLKIGIYKWDWKEDPSRSVLTTRVVFHDRVLIGDANCTLQDLLSK